MGWGRANQKQELEKNTTILIINNKTLPLCLKSILKFVDAVGEGHQFFVLNPRPFVAVDAITQVC